MHKSVVLFFLVWEYLYEIHLSVDKEEPHAICAVDVRIEPRVENCPGNPKIRIALN